MQFSFFLSFSETKSIMFKAFVSRQIIIFNIHSIIPTVMLYAICIVGMHNLNFIIHIYGLGKKSQNTRKIEIIEKKIGLTFLQYQIHL